MRSGIGISPSIMDTRTEESPVRTGPDWGLVAVLLLLLLIPIAIWQLYWQLSAAASPQEASQPAPAEQGERPPRQDQERLRRGEREAERERITRAIDDAMAELRQMRMEQTKSPAGSWDEVIENKLEEVAELQRRLDELQR